jgi:hypothetical protein
MLDKLAPHSRVWVFQANRFLKDDEVKFVQEKMTEFIPTWASHGNELYGDFVLADNLFLIVGVDEKRSPTSGCSIDSLNRIIKKIGDEIKIDFFDRLRVAYLDSDHKIQLTSLGDFKALMKTDQVRQSTSVFNNLIETKADLDTKWKTTVKDSWHKNLIQIL